MDKVDMHSLVLTTIVGACIGLFWGSLRILKIGSAFQACGIFAIHWCGELLIHRWLMKLGFLSCLLIAYFGFLVVLVVISLVRRAKG